jgi:hypothetical protein
MSNITPTGEHFCRVKFGSALGDVFEEAVAMMRVTPDVPFCFEFNGVLFHVDRTTTVEDLHKRWEVRRMGYT